MSLLDRVQRRAEEAGSAPGRPSADAPGPGSPAPGGWQVRHAPASPYERRESAPASGFEESEAEADEEGSPQTPATAPRPRASSVSPNDPGRQSPLLNRTGLARRGLPKGAGLGPSRALR